MRRLRAIGFWLLVALIVAFSLFPFYYAIVSSLRPASQLFEPAWVPAALTLDNYASVFAEQPFGRNLLPPASPPPTRWRECASAGADSCWRRYSRYRCFRRLRSFQECSN
jgi:ABC-type maltose transport system permease subunit